MVSWINYSFHLPKVGIGWIRNNPKLAFFLAALIITSIILRYYNLSHLLYWMLDEERDAFLVKKIITDKDPILIGGSIPGGFYLAPGYFYVSSIFYFLSGGNPIGPAIAASALGVASSVIIFYVTKKLFNKKTAVIVSIFYTCSYLIISYNRTWWPLTFAPIISLTAYLFLFLIIKNKNYKYFLPLSLMLALGAQSDPSNFSTILLVLVVWILYKLEFKNTYVISGTALFGISHISLLIFDLKHNFFNLRHLIHFFTSQQSSSIHFNSLLNSISLLIHSFARVIFVSPSPDFAKQIAPSNYYVNLKYLQTNQILILISTAVLTYFFISFLLNIKKKNKNFGLVVLGLHLIIAFFGVITYNLFFPGYTQEWFFQVLFPLYAIALGYVVMKLSSFLKSNLIPILLIAIYVSSSFITIFHATNSYNYYDKEQSVKWAISQVEEPFTLYSFGDTFAWGGYRYLFYLFGKEPVRSYTDDAYGNWLYKLSDKNIHPKSNVIIANQDFYYDQKYEGIYNTYKAFATKYRKFGRIEVFIISDI